MSNHHHNAHNVPASSSSIATANSLGFFAFACTTLVFGLSTVTAGGVSQSNVVLGMAISTGGIAQMLAGMWEVPFTLFGSFWLSYAAILIPGSGIVASYPTVRELHTALGFFFTAWFAASLLVTYASLKKPTPFIVLFGFLTSSFAFLGAGEFAAVQAVTKVGGALGVVTALVAYYLAVGILIAADQPPALP
ncbi:Gpr1 family protein [Mycena pura]|uniref:Gpr1 family protein n=1 Tax=Mycena pura TaxID=153505 RepID=A0AAD6UQQ8_9AGAR|nr:Gpr1 family protein [Mycena pura]